MEIKKKVRFFTSDFLREGGERLDIYRLNGKKTRDSPPLISIINNSILVINNNYSQFNNCPNGVNTAIAGVETPS